MLLNPSGHPLLTAKILALAFLDLVKPRAVPIELLTWVVWDYVYSLSWYFLAQIEYDVSVIGVEDKHRFREGNCPDIPIVPTHKVLRETVVFF